MARTVAVVTGTRAEYGLLRSSMQAIERHPDLALVVLATGMHLSPTHGYTVNEIEDDGFGIDRRIHMLVAGDSGRAMAKSLGIGIAGLSEALGDLDPDILLVLGDRDEALAGAVTAAHMNVPVGHIHGGEITQGGMIDDSNRHAITKYSHIHFPVTEESEQRILSLGEESWRVTPVGAPGLDDVHAGRFDDPATVVQTLGIDSSRHLILVVQHPVTSLSSEAGSQMQSTLDAVTDIDAEVVVIYPNTDAGGMAMIEAIDGVDEFSSFHRIPSLPRRQFLALLAEADVLVGNSSSGLIEAPSFDLPVVDIGPRQEDRQRGDNITHVEHDRDQIREAVTAALNDPEIRRNARLSKNPYDRGGAAELIVDRLATVELNERLVRKRHTL